MGESRRSIWQARTRELREAVFSSPGKTSKEQRCAAAANQAPEDLSAYIAKVHEAAYKITDEDVAALKAAGNSEDAILELTVAAATGAGLRRLEAGLAAMKAPAHDEAKEATS